MTASETSRVVLFALSLTTAGCGPAAVDPFEQDVRALCIKDREVCYGGKAIEEAVEDCVDYFTQGERERARAMGAHCVEIYEDLFSCLAALTCEEYLTVLDVAGPCHDRREELNRDCPGLSPISGDADAS